MAGHRGKVVKLHVKFRALEMVMSGMSLHRVGLALNVRPDTVNNWLRAWGTTAKACRMSNFVPPKGFKPSVSLEEPEPQPNEEEEEDYEIEVEQEEGEDSEESEGDDDLETDDDPEVMGSGAKKPVPQVAKLMRQQLNPDDPSTIVKFFDDLQEGMSAIAREQADVLDEAQVTFAGVIIKMIKGLTLPNATPPINTVTDLKALGELFLKITGRDQKQGDAASRIDSDILDKRFRVAKNGKKKGR
jgi:transposase-like protein